MVYRATLRGTRYAFEDLRTLLARASPRRAADELAELAASTAVERVAAQLALAEVPLKRFLAEDLIPGELDEVTRLIHAQHDPVAFRPLSHLTVGELREWLLREDVGPEQLARVRDGLTPEMVSAVIKLMRLQDLVAVASRCRVVTHFRSTVGLHGRMATRLQPNHPTDDPVGIAASIFDGLLYGSGDACIGINPATDQVDNVHTLLSLVGELIERFQIPTQSCVLAHVTTTLALASAGAPVDLCFQSIAGTEKANRSFGIDLALLTEAREATLALGRGGDQVMYFETGQGSALSADAHMGVDAQTCEVRAYAVARAFSPFLVNSVVGFIGPEYLYDGKQILRAGLEDHLAGKLLGLPMGCDVCYTNHAEADQDDMDALLTLLGVSGVNFVMGVPGADDIMLNYQSTSFHDALYVRQVLGKRPSPEMERWLVDMEILEPDGLSLVSEPGHRSPLIEGLHLVGSRRLGRPNPGGAK